MRTRLTSFLFATLTGWAALAHGEGLGQSMGIFVYPAGGQSAEQQGQDDYECFSWAKQQTGYDPMNPPSAVAQAHQEGPSGTRLRGAARGAAAGAIIGEVADDDAGKGAAIGATAGALRGGRQDRLQRQEHAQQAEQNATAQASAAENQFRTAYSTCMQGREYSVNF